MSRCTHYTGRVRCEATATRYVMTEEGKPCPGSHVCQEHGEACVAEYRAKLGPWSLARCDEYGYVRKDPHMVRQPDGSYAVFSQGRTVLNGETYVVASNVLHELISPTGEPSECAEVAEAIRAAAS